MPAACYSDSNGATRTDCVRPTVTFQSGHGFFSAMCFTDYTHAKTATPELAGLADTLPGACDLFDQIFTNTPANSFANGNHPYPSLHQNDNGSYHPIVYNSWWGNTPAYSQGDDVDAWWISPAKSGEGLRNQWWVDQTGRYDLGLVCPNLLRLRHLGHVELLPKQLHHPAMVGQRHPRHQLRRSRLAG